MPIRPATRQQAESSSVPPLQIMPRLEAVGDGYAGSSRAVAGFGLRAGLLALLIAAVTAGAAFLLLHGSDHGAGRLAGPGSVPGQLRAPRSRPLIRVGADAAVAEAGVRLAVAGLRGPAHGAARGGAATRSSSNSTPVSHAHYLSSSELVSLADGSDSYRPPGYLVRAYGRVAARYHVPWRLLAAIEYINGGYAQALAGTTARAERELSEAVATARRPVVNVHVLARATAAASQPSLRLLADARHLAADGASTSPAQAAAAFMEGTGTSAQAVLTLAQAINHSGVTSASAPGVKVATMLNEARLLNGLPYVWGGGHTNPAWVVGSGYDCSGFVSEVLHSAGYLNSPDTTQTLPGSAGILKGPGKYVTIYDRTIATLKVWVKKRKTITIRKAVNPNSAGVHVDRGRRAKSLSSVAITLPKWVGEWKTIKVTKLVPSLDNNNNDEHVIIDIDGQWWESGGSSADGGAAQVHRIIKPSKGYLKSFNRILHPQGL